MNHHPACFCLFRRVVLVAQSVAVYLFPCFVAIMEIHYMGVDPGVAISANFMNMMIQFLIQIPFTVPIFKMKGICYRELEPYAHRLTFFLAVVGLALNSPLKYMAEAVIENLTISTAT